MALDVSLVPCFVVSVITDSAILCDEVGFVVGLLDGCLAGVRRQHKDWRVLSTLEVEQEVRFVRAAAVQQQARLAAAVQRRARRQYSSQRRQRVLPLARATKPQALLVVLVS